MRKFIYVLVALVVALVLWEVLGAGNRVTAPTVTRNATPASAPATSTVSSAYFSEGTSSALGRYLTDPNGMTLYTFTHDTPGVSNCTSACLEKWPPYGSGLSATSGTPVNLPMLPANVQTIKGRNGMVQFTWNGMPLYYYYQDKAPGDTLGEGILDAWYVVKL